MLAEQRDQLLVRMNDMQASLDRLNQKIEHYEQGLMRVEKKLLDMKAARNGEEAVG